MIINNLLINKINLNATILIILHPTRNLIMKKLFILLLVPLLFGCEIQYDGNTKLVIKGSVVDRYNNPIINKAVNLYVSRDGGQIPFLFYIPTETNYIGKATTDNDGNYVMVIPQPRYFSEIIIETNEESNQLNGKQFRNIALSNFTDFQYVAPISKLYSKTDLANLTVNLNNINSTTELLKLEYIGNIPNEIEFVNPLEEDYPNFIQNLNVEKNQTVILKYKTINHLTNTTTTNQANITIDNSNTVNYTLNY